MTSEAWLFDLIMRCAMGEEVPWASIKSDKGAKEGGEGPEPSSSTGEAFDRETARLLAE